VLKRNRNAVFLRIFEILVFGVRMRTSVEIPLESFGILDREGYNQVGAVVFGRDE